MDSKSKIMLLARIFNEDRTLDIEIEKYEINKFEEILKTFKAVSMYLAEDILCILKEKSDPLIRQGELYLQSPLTPLGYCPGCFTTDYYYNLNSNTITIITEFQEIRGTREENRTVKELTDKMIINSKFDEMCEYIAMNLGCNQSRWKDENFFSHLSLELDYTI